MQSQNNLNSTNFSSTNMNTQPLQPGQTTGMSQTTAYPPGTTTTTFYPSGQTTTTMGSGLPAGMVAPGHQNNVQGGALKGNITSMMGKLQHNPQKEQDGNIMVANASEQKAARFETKALEWDRKGNTAKAQKNREKAARYRQKAIAKMNQPLKSAGTARPIGSVGTTPGNPALKSDKAARCEAKALEYERKGNLAKAQKNRERAWRIREKNGIPHPVGAVPPLGYSSTTTSYSSTTTAVPLGTTQVPINPSH